MTRLYRWLVWSLDLPGGPFTHAYMACCALAAAVLLGILAASLLGAP
jgi:hypothetical protein